MQYFYEETYAVYYNDPKYYDDGTVNMKTVWIIKSIHNSVEDAIAAVNADPENHEFFEICEMEPWGDVAKTIVEADDPRIHYADINKHRRAGYGWDTCFLYEEYSEYLERVGS